MPPAMLSLCYERCTCRTTAAAHMLIQQDYFSTPQLTASLHSKLLFTKKAPPGVAVMFSDDRGRFFKRYYHPFMNLTDRVRFFLCFSLIMLRHLGDPNAIC